MSIAKALVLVAQNSFALHINTQGPPALYNDTLTHWGLHINTLTLFTATVKITAPRTAAGKTHVGPVNLLFIIMFKTKKIKPNSGSVQQKPKSFHGDSDCIQHIEARPPFLCILLNNEFCIWFEFH